MSGLFVGLIILLSMITSTLLLVLPVRFEELSEPSKATFSCVQTIKYSPLQFSLFSVTFLKMVSEGVHFL